MTHWSLMPVAIVLVFIGLTMATVSGQTTTTSTANFTTGSHTVYYTSTTSSHTTTSSSNTTGKPSTTHVTPVEALIGLGVLFIFCVGAPFIWIYRKWKARTEPIVDW